MKAAREVLKILTEKFPPLEGRRHCLMLDTEPGSSDVLAIGLSFGSEWLGVKLTDMKDLDREPAEIVHEIVGLVEQKIREEANKRIAEAMMADALKAEAAAKKKNEDK